MNSNILLGKILQRFCDSGISRVEGFNSFEYLRETSIYVYVKRENGQETSIPFKKIIVGIEAFKLNPELFNLGPSALRPYGITHITSPIWSLLHLLAPEEYDNGDILLDRTQKKSILNIYGVLEHELELTWRIYELALKAYHHADYLFHKDRGDEMRIVSNSMSLKFIRIVCARTCVLEISKLITEGQNNHYSFWNLVNRIKNKKFVGNINISANTLSEIESSLLKNKDNIKTFKTIRDKLVAHDDFDNYLIPRPLLSDLLPLLEMTYNILCKLCVEQYQKECPPGPKNNVSMDLENFLNMQKFK